jgi:hypothetical protein
MSPISNLSLHKRAFSVNQTVNKHNFYQSPGPLGDSLPNSRPPSSFISKHSGLPQVFLDKYTRNHRLP